MKNYKAITPKQKKILDFIKNFIIENEYSPSLEEIASHMGTGSSTVQAHIYKMKQRGVVDYTPNGKRTITLMEG